MGRAGHAALPRVALERALLLGEVGPDLLWHAGYLALLCALGVVGTSRRIASLLLRSPVREDARAVMTPSLR